MRQWSWRTGWSIADEEAIDQVVQPKVQGALNLERLTAIFDPTICFSFFRHDAVW